MAIFIRTASVMAAMAFLVTTHPALAVKADHANGRVGQGDGSGGSKGGDHGAKGTPAPVAGIGIFALGALGYGMRRMRARKRDDWVITSFANTMILGGRCLINQGA